MDSPPDLPVSQLRGIRTPEAHQALPVSNRKEARLPGQGGVPEGFQEEVAFEQSLKDNSQRGAPQTRNSPSSRPHPSYLLSGKQLPGASPGRRLPSPSAGGRRATSPARNAPSPPPPSPLSPPHPIPRLPLSSPFCLHPGPPPNSPSLRPAPGDFQDPTTHGRGRRGVAPYARGWGFLKNLPQTLQPEGKGSSAPPLGLGPGQPEPHPLYLKAFLLVGFQLQEAAEPGPQEVLWPPWRRGMALPGTRRLARVWGSTCPPCAPLRLRLARLPRPPCPWLWPRQGLDGVWPTGAGKRTESTGGHLLPRSCPALPTSFPRHSLSSQAAHLVRLTRPPPTPQVRPGASLRGSEPPKCCTSLEVGLDAPMAPLPQADTPPRPRAQAPAGR